MTSPWHEDKADIAHNLDYDLHKIRTDFPLLHQEIHGKPLVYLDNAATAQKPKQVIDRVAQYYSLENANIHRGVHHLSENATIEYEAARETIQRFINARGSSEIIFVRGTTEALNLIAGSFGRSSILAGDEIIISTMEHHSNIVPWQILCQEKQAHLRIIPVSDEGELDLGAFAELFGPKTKLVSITHMSNALGTINPVKEMIEIAHRSGVPCVLDGAQSISHIPVDVQDLDCDFYAFSGHKLYGPSGIGVLYGKAEILETLPPYQSGGDMISSVTFEQTHYNELPYKFEAGTPNIAGAIGLGAAVDYVAALGLERIAAHERNLLSYGASKLETIEGLRLIGTAPERASILSFVLNGIHPHDIGTVLDQEGVAIRAGHHCAQPLMDRYAIPATARASLALYNTVEEVDALVAAVEKTIEVLS